MLCPAQSPNLRCSHLVACTPYQELYLWFGQKKWRDPATAELLWHRLQWASYGAGGSRPPAAALLGEAPVAVGLGSGALGWRSCSRGAQRWCRMVGLGAGASGWGSDGSGVGAGVEGRGSGGRGPQRWWQRGSCGDSGSGLPGCTCLFTRGIEFFPQEE
jgi:hypothetical protein